jgi:hypothetical protein
VIIYLLSMRQIQLYTSSVIYLPARQVNQWRNCLSGRWISGVSAYQAVPSVPGSGIQLDRLPSAGQTLRRHRAGVCGRRERGYGTG